MKQPRLKDLALNQEETEAIRRAAKRGASVKITINIDSDSLAQLRKMASETGVPYQRILNRVLRQGLSDASSAEKRLDRLEKEVERLKRKFVA